MKSIIRIFAWVIFAQLMACNNIGKTDSNGSLKGRISISGAFALYPMAQKWAEEFMKLHPGVTVDISAGGAGKGMMDVLSGMVDLGMVSREVKQEELTKGAWFVAVTKDAVLPVMNAANPFFKEINEKGLTNEQFRKIFLTEKPISWGEILANGSNNKISRYTRSDFCGASEMWAKYLGKKQEDLQGTGVYGDPGMAEAVRNDKLGIGYNNVIYVYDLKTRKLNPGMAVVPVDINANGKLEKEEQFYYNLDTLMNAVKAGIYPSPPARELYLVSKGKPTNSLVIEFLKFVLGEGQKYVKDGGYVNLSEKRIGEELKKLE